MATTLDDAVLTGIRRRTLVVLSAGQVLGGLAFGATVSLGAVLAAAISGDEAFAGLAAAAITLGAAAFAVPLASLARRRGRRISLAVGTAAALGGVVLVVVAVAAASFALLLVAFAVTGAGQAVNLQSRFAATDLATSATRGRDLSVVVWATTIGAVLGPNLVGPGEVLGGAVGMPPLTGPYLFTVAAQALAVALYLVGLRPDPLRIAAQLTDRGGRRGGSPLGSPDQPRVAHYAIGVVVGAQLAMVAVMAMTPVHLLHMGADVTVIGFTISLHIAGMYALSPLFGWLADRWGRLPTILLGQALLTAALLVAAAGSSVTALVTVALVLLGLGWSCSTVAAAALLTEATSEALRTRRQGRSDLVMNLVAALGAIGAGVILGWIGYGGLALSALVVVAVVVGAMPWGRRPAPATA